MNRSSESPEPTPQPKTLDLYTLEQASREYLDSIQDGEEPLYSTGLPPLDAAMDGGVARGEVTIVAARPGIGKTMMAIQWAQFLASEGVRVAFLSEEMTAKALGKRVVQMATTIERPQWRDRMDDVYGALDDHWSKRTSILIPHQKCRTYARAAEAIEILAERHGVEVVFVDYLQRLRGAGNGRYEEVTNGSIAMASQAVESNVSLVLLAQLNRQTDHDNRPPKFCDLRDSGQIEQDADNIIFLDWPLKRNPAHKPPHQYYAYIAKCRNRGVHRSVVELRIEPTRQRLTAPIAANYTQAFSDWNDGKARAAGEDC